jgi:beta-glucosidase
MDKYRNQFPKNFLWGASTASHQVEGNNHNQWSVWELQVAQNKAKHAKADLDWLSNWDDIKNQAEDPNNYISGKGVDHFKLFKEDIKLISKLNLNSYRFGIEWSRIEPKEGQWNQEAINHYKDYINELNKNKIEPLLNIWHWTLPVWFSEKGGFKNKANLIYWKRFVQKIADEFGLMIQHIITLNEPNVYTSHSYIMGWWPPQEKSWISGAKVTWHLVLAHKYAYRILKKKNPSLNVGIAQQLANIQAKRPHNFFDQIMTKWMRYIWNWWFYHRIKNYQDFIGFNYYFTDYYRVFKRDNPEVPTNDLGWYMEPEGLYPLLLRVWTRYRKPIIITENGVADSSDQYRQWWLEESIIAMERALSEGVQLVGYYHWSLLDNFEWAYGWWPKFGLVEVDRKTMKRTIRPSAKWLAKEIKNIKSSHR